MKNSIKRIFMTAITISLSSTLCSPSSFALTDVSDTDNGWNATVRRETSTPGGFSAVAEPAGPNRTRSTGW